MGSIDLLIQLSRELHRAWASSDVARLEQLVTEDYVHIDASGKRFNRAAWLAYAGEPRAPGELGFADEVVTVLDPVAVITSQLSIPALDVPRIRVMQVWQQQRRGWRRGWYQATPITSPE